MPSHHPVTLAVSSSQVTEKLLEVENETMMKVADLEKLLIQKDKDLQAIRVSSSCYAVIFFIFIFLPFCLSVALRVFYLSK